MLCVHLVRVKKGRKPDNKTEDIKYNQEEKKDTYVQNAIDKLQFPIKPFFKIWIKIHVYLYSF